VFFGSLESGDQPDCGCANFRPLGARDELPYVFRVDHGHLG
jgi:hypothetical protein